MSDMYAEITAPNVHLRNEAQRSFENEIMLKVK